jgi:hypothetical protein
MNDELEKIWKEVCRGLIWGTLRAFVWSDWERLRKTSVRVASVPTDIRIQHLPNETVSHYW